MADPDATFGKMKSLLLEFHARKPLAITQIQESHILVDLVNDKAPLEREEAQAVIEFNKTEFGVQESTSDERDKRRSWMKKRFLTVGAI